MEVVRLARDFLTEKNKCIKHLFGAGRTARNVDIDRNQFVDPLYGSVVVIEPAG